MGPGGRRLGPGVRRGVCAGGRGELHAVRGEDEDGSGRRRGASAQCLHGEGGRQDGAVHRQLRLPEAKGRRVPVLRAQAAGVVLGVPVAVAGSLPTGGGDGSSTWDGRRTACLHAGALLWSCWRGEVKVRAT